jgi:hypothetical protein
MVARNSLTPLVCDSKESVVVVVVVVVVVIVA